MDDLTAAAAAVMQPLVAHATTTPVETITAAPALAAVHCAAAPPPNLGALTATGVYPL